MQMLWIERVLFHVEEKLRSFHIEQTFDPLLERTMFAWLFQNLLGKHLFFSKIAAQKNMWS